MKKYIPFILLNMGITLIAAEPLVHKPHEEWWEKNVEKMFGEFQSWLEDTNATTRVRARGHIKLKNYKLILDIPCGLCTEFFGYQKDAISIDYYGIDITPFLVKRGTSFGLKVIQGSIENIPFKDSSVDVCYARHILEHLDYYEKAVNELIRVADKEVIVVFFKIPTDEADYIFLDTSIL